MLRATFDEIAIERELADEWIDLAQAQRQLRIAFQVAAYEAVFACARFQSQGASVIGGGHAVLLGQVREHAQDAAHRSLLRPGYDAWLWHNAPMCGPAISQRGNSSCSVLNGASCGTILLLDAMAAALLP